VRVHGASRRVIGARLLLAAVLLKETAGFFHHFHVRGVVEQVERQHPEPELDRNGMEIYHLIRDVRLLAPAMLATTGDIQ
jgi:hypothetical protein